MGAVFFAAIVFAGFLAALRAAGFVPAAFFLAGFAATTRCLVAVFREPDFDAALAGPRRRLAAADLRALVFLAGRTAFDLAADLTRFGAE